MKFLTGALLASSASAAVGKATLEWNCASDSGAGSNGALKVRKTDHTRSMAYIPYKGN